MNMDADEQQLAAQAATHRKRAELFCEAGEVDDAIAAYEQALDVEPDLESTRRLADLLAHRNGSGDAEQAADLYFTLADLLGNPEGIELLERTLDQAPDHSEALTLLESWLPQEQHGARLATRWAAFMDTSADLKAVAKRKQMLIRAQAVDSGALAPRSGRTMVSYKIPAEEPRALELHDGTKIPSEPPAAAPVNTAAKVASVAPRASSVPPQAASRSVAPRASSVPPQAASRSVAPRASSVPPQAASHSVAPKVATRRLDPFAPASPGSVSSHALPKRTSVPPLTAARPVSTLPPTAAAANVARASVAPSMPATTSRAPEAKPSTPPPPVVLDNDPIEIPTRGGWLQGKTLWIGGGIAAAGTIAAIAFGSASSKPAPVVMPTTVSSPSAAAMPSAAPAPVPVPSAEPTPTTPAAAAAPTAAPTPPTTPSAPEGQPAAAETKPEVAKETPKLKGPGVKMLIKQTTVKGGKLDVKELASSLKALQPELDRCYAKALEKKPKTVGQLILTWTVKKNGKPSGVRKASGTLKDAPLTRCATQAVSGGTFPKPEKKVSTVKMPVSFGR